MNEDGESSQKRRELSRRERITAIEAWDAERKRQLDKIKAELRARHREERRENFSRNMTELWPMWVGLLMGLLGPQIKFIAQSIGPWCMELVFPFVALAQRPEAQVGHIASLIPIILVYTQFPLEGLFAYFVLRHTVRPAAVVLEVTLLHCLGLAELWMLTGTPFFLLRH